MLYIENCVVLFVLIAHVCICVAKRLLAHLHTYNAYTYIFLLTFTTQEREKRSNKLTAWFIHSGIQLKRKTARTVHFFLLFSFF